MNFDPKELEMGTKIEHEHTNDEALARKIATDHLKEDPHYYTKLKKAGLEEGDEDSKWDDYKKAHGDDEVEDAYGHKHKVKDLNWHEPKGKRMAAPKKEGALTPLEAGMAECGGVDDGCPEDAGLPVAPLSHMAPARGGVVLMVKGAEAGQTPLASSGLGDSGTPKPLTSDKLETPEEKMVGPNKIATSKTPPLMGDSSITDDADPMDHFGSEMLGLYEGGAQIKKK